jgi:hypothetical protein
MRPAITSWPPIHSRKPTAAKTMKITSVVISARRPMRATAASNAFSVARAKRRPARSSWAKACTVRTASSVSPPSDTMSATRACASRDRPPHGAAEQDDRRHHHRHHGDHPQRELGVGDHQHDDAAHAHQRVAQRDRRPTSRSPARSAGHPTRCGS